MSQDLLIVGCGVMGAATACQAARLGARVTLLEAHGYNNRLAASADLSKVFRFAYGSDAQYVRWARESLALWRQLESDTGAALLHQTGMLLLGVADGGYAADSFHTLQAAGESAEWLAPADVEQHYPQFTAASLRYAVLDPQGGILAADAAVEAMVHLAISLGVRYVPGQSVMAVEQRGARCLARTQGGDEFGADAMVLAVNGWINRVLGVEWVTNTRQPVLYYRPRYEREQFLPDHFPVYAELDSGFYGFPLFGMDAVKIANHLPGPPIDPDHRERDDGSADRAARRFFECYLPALYDSELVRTHICFYDNSADGDFVLDNVPGMERVVVAAGFSGHGFKFAPLIGKVLAHLALRGEEVLPLERFRLQRFLDSP